ncbi:MAG: hypothetical protein ACKPH7_07230 [Planktothrix sp.]|uniref:hypothetical protein n=1 Tax=Planktothrix sp. TaxID=3088171 RepID=UPI0038D4BD36
MTEFNFDDNYFNSEIDGLITNDLSNQFIKLIDERDSIIDSEGYNARCEEIDDDLIPQIIKKIPKWKMDLFNKLINRK